MILFRQENVKYLPGVKLGANVVADPDLANAGMFKPLIDNFELDLSSL